MPIFVILGLLGVAIPQTLVYVGNKVPILLSLIDCIYPLYTPQIESTHT